jgi:hypothetical protein
MDSKYSFRSALLHYGSALAVIAADWLIYAVNVASFGGYFLAVDLLGALAALVGVAAIQSRVAHARTQTAWLKALLCAFVVAYPLPTLGTVLGTVALVWNSAVRFRGRAAA